MISFIVIGRNEGWRLKKCLQSITTIINQDKIIDYEIIYVDSQSSDNSVELAKQYGAKVFLITGECNAAIARNIGAKEAMGDILFFIDGDMELFSGFLPKVLTQDGRLEYPFISGIFNDVVHDLDWNYLYTSRRHKLQEGDEDAVQTTTGGLFMIEHSLWNQVKGLDTRLKIGEDYDIGLRLTKLGFPLHRKATLLANHYTRQCSLGKDHINYVKYTALLLRKHWNNRNYLKIFIMQQYTTTVLLITVILSLISIWFLGLYVLVCIYKNIKQDNWKRMWTPIARDIVLIWALLCFRPSKHKLKYKLV
ncbi:MAG: glycosyltransferase [Paludibacteraceae bacterium]|nr:glycosyltransferase [Paludibacteraceae bacterium]